MTASTATLAGRRHIAAVGRGAALAGCLVGAVLFIWSSTVVRAELPPHTKAAYRHRVMTFADLAPSPPEAGSRDVIRLVPRQVAP